MKEDRLKAEYIKTLLDDELYNLREWLGKLDPVVDPDHITELIDVLLAKHTLKIRVLLKELKASKEIE